MSAVPAVFRIKSGAKSIISSQASFIIIYAACGPRHVKSRNGRIRFPRNRKLFRFLSQSRNSVSCQPKQQVERGFILILSSQSGWTESSLISQTGQPGKRSQIHSLRCGHYVRRHLRCIKTFPDHRKDRHEKELRSSATSISWIHTPMLSICSAEGTAVKSKPFTLTKQDSSWCRKGWMESDVSSGRGMLLKQGFFPGRNSGGLWKAFPLTSQRQSGSVGGRRIFNLCEKQRFYKFLFLFQVKDNGHLSTVLFLRFLDLWMFPLQVRLWFFICG